MATISAVPQTRIAGGSFLLEERSTEETFTPEDFTEQHRLIGQTAEEFVVNEISPTAEKIEHKDFSISRDLLKKAGDLGLSGLRFPRPTAALKWTKLPPRSSPTHRQIRRALPLPGERIAVSGMLPIVYFGTEEQKKKYLPRLATGEIVGAYALSEATSGSDALNCRARAVLSSDGESLHPERREDVDHQCRLRRPVYGVRQGRRREIHGVSGRRNFPWLLGRRRRAQDGHSRIVHLPNHSQ